MHHTYEKVFNTDIKAAEKFVGIFYTVKAAREDKSICFISNTKCVTQER